MAKRRLERTRPRRVYVWRIRRSRLRAEFHARIASMVPTSAGGWLVDVGCGPGQLLERLRSTTKACLVGIDLDLGMLRTLRKARCGDGILATSARIPFKDGTVETVVSTASLKDWRDREAGLQEIVRILRPGAVAYVYDFITRGPGSGPGGFAKRYGIVSEVLRRAMGFFVPFTVAEARRLGASLRNAKVTIGVESDLGIVQITIRKPSGSEKVET